MPAQSDLAAIRKIVKNTDHHRTRAVREAWAEIKVILFGEEPVVEEAVAEDAPVDEAETPLEPAVPGVEGTATVDPASPVPGTVETTAADPAATAPAAEGERTSRFAEPPQA